VSRREIEGEWIMGWPDRRRPVSVPRKDDQGRITFQRSPWADLEGLITPTDLRYIVAQLEMPEPVHPDDWSLSVEGEVDHPLTLSLDDVQQFPGRTVRVVHECSGTDADFFDYLREGGERPSQFDLQQLHTGQTSSGEFTGVPLRTVLEAAGIRSSAVAVLGQGFDRGIPGEGSRKSYERMKQELTPEQLAAYDEIRTKPGVGTTHGASYIPDEAINFEKALPLEKAMDEDTLLAWAMNGEYLRHVHGAPLRLLVPGWSGNWSVKWLQRIAVFDHMPRPWYQSEYFYYADSPESPDHTMLTAMGVRCLVTDPRDHTRDGEPPLPAGRNIIRGLAWSGEGRIDRVEVSFDQGETWRAAHIEEPREKWLWVRWSFAWDAEPGRHIAMARAWDEAGRTCGSVPFNFLRKNFDGVVPVEIVVEG
jgi:DMSO/TMAO reductase YedYZ molybdopterin-dependent catalytic subunit